MIEALPFIVGWLPTQLWVLYGTYEYCWKELPYRADETKYETAYDYAANRVTWGRVFAVPFVIGIVVATVWWTIYAVMAAFGGL